MSLLLFMIVGWDHLESDTQRTLTFDTAGALLSGFAFATWAILRPMARRDTTGRGGVALQEKSVANTRAATLALMFADFIILLHAIQATGGLGKSPFDAFLLAIPTVLAITRSATRIAYLYLAVAFIVYGLQIWQNYSHPPSVQSLGEFITQANLWIGGISLGIVLIEFVFADKGSFYWDLEFELRESQHIERVLKEVLHLDPSETWDPTILDQVCKGITDYIATLHGFGFDRVHISKSHAFDCTVGQSLVLAGAANWIAFERKKSFPSELSARALDLPPRGVRATAFSVPASHWVDDLFDMGILNVVPIDIEREKKIGFDSAFSRIQLDNAGFGMGAVAAEIIERAVLGQLPALLYYPASALRVSLAAFRGPVAFWGDSTNRAEKLFSRIIRLVGGQSLLEEYYGLQVSGIKRGISRVQLAGLMTNTSSAQVATSISNWLKEAVGQNHDVEGVKARDFAKSLSPWWTWASSKIVMELWDSHFFSPMLTVCDLSNIAAAPILYYHNIEEERALEAQPNTVGIPEAPQEGEFTAVIERCCLLLEAYVESQLERALHDGGLFRRLSWTIGLHYVRLSLVHHFYCERMPQPVRVATAKYIECLRRLHSGRQK